MNRLFTRLLSASSLLLACAACSIYTPMTPHAPIIRAQGEGEVSFQLQGTGRAELQAAYSPCKSLLLLAAATGRPKLFTDSAAIDPGDGLRTLQYEVGAGTYFPMGERWSGQLIGGFGAAQVERTVSEFGIFLAFSNNYNARYQKYFGQISFNKQLHRHGMGFGYRLALIDFSELSAQNRQGDYTLYPLPLDSQLRHELFYSYRRWLGRELAESHWYLQAGGGLSFCLPGRTDPVPYDDVDFRARFNRGGVVGIGYSLQKH
ncbi:hypothetical protein Q5H93_21160 [Hymenobacter sp. ASUV-10]|uniref:Outer membrane protein beta-barrel domain-containing protein n=1 Tax=Hymenobacter aranciens TaxID=3063996 RepID=A0ABT9BHX7_9BACT|nr:hypothetical protein [Hymenobacter sp. ASUV-10]MDO7877268.1 hypothetical protein [Hymenobacter sp. ASUV-10]